MTPPLEYALTVGPLGFYLWVVAVWQSGRHPKVVNGLVDFSLLALGIGGVLAFGPFGQLMARRLFSRPDAWDWLSIASGLGLVATLLARRSLRQIVVYHVGENELHQALVSVLGESGHRFVRTFQGYEEPSGARGLRVEISWPLRSTVIEALGPDSEALIREIRSRLRDRLRRVASPRTSSALILYLASLAVILGPLVTLFVTQPRAREALRVLLERIRGG